MATDFESAKRELADIGIVLKADNSFGATLYCICDQAGNQGVYSTDLNSIVLLGYDMSCGTYEATECIVCGKHGEIVEGLCWMCHQ